MVISMVVVGAYSVRVYIINVSLPFTTKSLVSQTQNSAFYHEKPWLGVPT